MKKKIICILVIIGILLSMSIPASARASDYLDQYTVGLSAEGNGKMAICVTVDGVTKMDKIGLLEVAIDEKYTSTGSWHEYEVYYGMDDPDKYYDYDSYDYFHTLYFDGVPGRYYRVTLTVYAGDSTGHDTGWITSPTTRCK